MAGADKRNDYAVRSVIRAARILELVRTSDGGAQLNELASRSGLAKASAFRLLRTLEQVGLIQRVPNSDVYRLGVRCLELGQTYLEQTDLRREAAPVLQDLQRRFKETVHLGVLDDELRVVYLEKLETSHAIGIMMSRVGRTAPSYCTGLGKAMLASLDGDPAAVLSERGELRRYTANTICDRDALSEELARVRKRGFAVDLEEHEVGVRCVASTIHAPREVAAISVAGPAQRLPERRLRRELAQAVIAAASEISRRLGSPQRREAGDTPRR